MNGAATLTFLLAALPAAQAHDDAPTAAQVFWGIGACLFTGTWLALACFRALRPGRHSYLQIRLGRILPRRLYRETPTLHRRLPRFRARQASRAALRRRR
ncbi:MAG TPA: hypothetical protein VKT32_08915 [Chthonomonadaceae bacterium]|nr:hypothetical protein [Chthonomonadaceae bacterium]